MSPRKSLKSRVKTEENVKPQNKMNKSFVRSAGSEIAPAYPVFKPVKLPDFQIGDIIECYRRLFK
jgi:hypothetical protein